MWTATGGMAYDVGRMKRLPRRLLLGVLLLFELWLLTAFSPTAGSNGCTANSRKCGLRASRVTHPVLEQELRPFAPFGFAVLGILAVVNAGVIFVVWDRRNRLDVECRGWTSWSQDWPGARRKTSAEFFDPKPTQLQMACSIATRRSTSGT